MCSERIFFYIYSHFMITLKYKCMNINIHLLVMNSYIYDILWTFLKFTFNMCNEILT
jgi:hypothetical protein